MSPSFLEQEQERLTARFVGRGAELALLRRLREPTDDLRVVVIHGPGGIGKTSLLHAFQREAKEAVYLDARRSQGKTLALLHLLGVALEERKDAPLVVLLVDTGELLELVEGNHRDALLALVGDRVRLVVAGRGLPGVPWRTMPSWGTAIREIALDALGADEAEEYLRRRGLEGDAIARLSRFAKGHPLSLALGAERQLENPTAPFVPTESPDVVGELCEQFLAGVTDPALRQAVEVSALLRTTTEDLLSAMLPDIDARTAFRWLRSLSFVETTPRGLFPHDLPREIIATDLAWRRPAFDRELLQRALQYWAARLPDVPEEAFPEAMAEFAFLVAKVPNLRAALAPPPDLDVVITPATAHDHGALREMVARHEGEISARLFDHWWSRQREGFRVVRGADGATLAFTATLRLDKATADDRRADPAIVAVWPEVVRRIGEAPLTAVPYGRWYMTQDGYHEVSPELAAALLTVAEPLVRLRDISLSFLYCTVGTPQWTASMEFTGASMLPAASFEVDGRSYEVAFHDRRGRDGVEWISRMLDRRVGSRPTQSRHSMDHEEFVAAIRNALRVLHDPARLSQSPLLDLPLVSLCCGPHAQRAERVRALAALLRDEIAALNGASRGNELHGVLELAYVEPARSQERAAEALGLSFSTYRRRLSDATDRLVESLWLRSEAAS